LESAVRLARLTIIALTAILFGSAGYLASLAFSWAGASQVMLVTSIPDNSSNPLRSNGAAHVAIPTSGPTTTAIKQGREGPWGRLELVPIVLEIPDSYAGVTDVLAAHDSWHFANENRDAAIEMMASCGFSSQQLEAIRSCDWSAQGNASLVVPSDALLLSLSPACRAAIYAKLLADPANAIAVDPFWFRIGKIDGRLRGSGLRESSIALLKRLVYPGQGNDLLFNDLKPAMRAIDDPAEQVLFFKAIARKRSLMARVQIDANTDTAQLAQYWGRGGREQSLIPILDALKINAAAGIENPSKINIVLLLPHFVQEKLYRHAEPSESPDQLPQDCFWTAFNFFNEVPDEHVHQLDYVTRLIADQYTRISEPSELGDLIILGDEHGNAIHAANFIADDIVFTKNGEGLQAPWIMVEKRDLISEYQMRNEQLTVAFYRKR
jgi:hypothetical protein